MTFRNGDDYMNCQRCQQRTANVHITQYINGQKHEAHLCEECAQAAKITVNLPQLPITNLKNLLAFLGQGNKVDRSVPELICKNCQTPYQKVHETGYVGCSDCYEQFTTQIEPALKKIHGTNMHRGKIPSRLGAIYLVKREIEDLKSRLRQAVGLEEYEKAADLRDRIKLLEDKQVQKREEENND